MKTARPWWLIVEPAPRWAPALRRELARRDRRAEATRVVAMTKAPPIAPLLAVTGPVVVALTPDSADLFQRLRLRRALCPVLCTPSHPGLVDGAVDVFYSTLEVSNLVDLSDRHAHNFSSDGIQLPWQVPPWEATPR